ncbi:AAA family ATPase [Crossiella cryophila]|uniref:Tetratricopeptide (TPR) repeat protein n=1 Tax=Crossiella cryophila TaxID=43355 RepID=A0A7W7C7D5_9PSEU|nr:AAA family ATPase [Crossiella cryophila]MBB4675812.1 tetratricopeptide (TPR) repeat protein [Crossiella cryophila]
MSTHNRISGQVWANLVVQGRDITVQQPVVPSQALSGLPPQPVFVGRDRELAELLDSLRAGSVVVTGLPGVGKTALAVRAAHELRPEFPGGVLFLDLRGYDTPITGEQALTDLLTALGEPAPTGQDACERSYRSALHRHQPLLLVADNASTTTQVQPLLPDGPHRLLVTSRHTLADLDARLLDLAVLPPAEAEALLAELLRQATGDDSRLGPELADLARLCGYLPLALRITAADLAAHPGQPLSARGQALADERELLSELEFGSELAVRASFDLSYRQLPPEQARMFRLLPVNPGEQVSTEAAAAIADLSEPAARRLLSELARAHLIEQGSRWDRWRLHDLLAAYAAELPEDGRAPALGRMVQHYGPVAEQASDHVMNRDNPPDNRFATLAAAMDWLDLEHRTLLELAHLARAHEEHGLVLLLSTTLTAYLSLRRRVADHVELASLALDSAISLANPQMQYMTAVECAEALLAAEAVEEAVRCAEYAVTFAERTEEPQFVLKAQGTLGATLHRAGDFAAQLECHQRQLELSRELGQPGGVADALAGLGRAHLGLGRVDEGLALVAESVRISGRREAQAIGWFRLADDYQQLGRDGEAAECLQRFVGLSRELGIRPFLAVGLVRLSGSHANLGRTAEAIECGREAAELGEQVADDSVAGYALGLLGSLLADAGQPEEARDCRSRALAIVERHHEPEFLELAELLRADLR